MESVSPISISPQDDDESEEERDEAAEDEAEVMPDALEQSRAVEANEDSGEPVVSDDDKLVVCWLPPELVIMGMGMPWVAVDTGNDIARLVEAVLRAARLGRPLAFFWMGWG